LRAQDLPQVSVEDHAALLKVWVRRRRELARTRNRLVNQLHAVLCELVAGGFAGEISAPQVDALLDRIAPSSAAGIARKALAAELLDDLRRLDRQSRDLHKRLATLVAASRTTTTKIYGVGPVVAATVLTYTGDVTRCRY
jgi:transposase